MTNTPALNDQDPVLIEYRDDIAIVRLNRPEVSNAVTPAMMARLCEALDAVIDNDQVHAIVLSHVGRHFLAGADFSFLHQLATSDAVHVRNEIYQYFQGAARRVHLCKKPVVAAIGGAAVTVGCELAIACDFRIVTENAFFQQSWIKLGLIGPLGSAKLLPQIVGWAVAKDMMLRARPVRGAEALVLGLATELVAESDRESRAIALAGELAASPPLAYAAMKEALWQGLEASFQDCWAGNVLAQALLIGSHDFKESLAAMKDKRSPSFEGR